MKINRWCLVIFSFSLFLGACGQAGSGDSSSFSTGNAGQAGSMSRFAIVNDMLYAIANDQLQLINIEDPAQPVLWSRIPVVRGIETLFPVNDYLFIGSQTGVFIYDNSNPLYPQYMSEFIHARSCDPVVVQGSYAYVTLRGNGRCWADQNQLDILNITDIANPVLEKSYPMQAPYGLGISGDKLFVCDGATGLKIYNVEDKSNIQITETLTEVNCYDVIPHNDILLVSAATGIFQYDFSGEFLVKLSEVNVGNVAGGL